MFAVSSYRIPKYFKVIFEESEPYILPTWTLGHTVKLNLNLNLFFSCTFSEVPVWEVRWQPTCNHLLQLSSISDQPGLPCHIPTLPAGDMCSQGVCQHLTHRQECLVKLPGTAELGDPDSVRYESPRIIICCCVYYHHNLTFNFVLLLSNITLPA